MKTIVAIASLAFSLSLCNLSERLANKGNQNSNNKNSATASATPAKTSLKDSFPEEVGEFKLQATYEKSELKGDEAYLPGATDVLGAIYRSGSKKEQVLVGSYPTEAEAEAARDKKVANGSRYPLRWTKGNLLFAAKNRVFKDEL